TSSRRSRARSPIPGCGYGRRSRADRARRRFSGKTRRSARVASFLRRSRSAWPSSPRRCCAPRIRSAASSPRAQATRGRSARAPGRPGERSAGEVPRVGFLRKMGSEEVHELRIVEARKQRSGGPIVEVAEPGRNPPLERPRVAAVFQHVEIVIAFEHERIAAAEAGFDMRSRHSEIGQDTDAPRAVADYILHGLACVMRYRDGDDFERSDGKTVVAVEAVD